MTARCADKSKQPQLHLRSRDSVQPDVMDAGVERTFSPQNFSMFPGSWFPFGLRRAKMLG